MIADNLFAASCVVKVKATESGLVTNQSLTYLCLSPTLLYPTPPTALFGKRRQHGETTAYEFRSRNLESRYV